MKTDELRRALDDLAGDAPEADDAFGVVTRRARHDRLRNRSAAVAVVAGVVAVVAFGVSRQSSPEHITLGNPTRPSTPTPTNVADLSWTRVGAPFNVTRVATAGGRTFAVGSAADGSARIGELEADGSWTSVDPAAGYARSATVSDLVGVPGALIAVGESGGSPDAGNPDAWRSTDGGKTWQSAQVETPAPSYRRLTMNRVVVSNGVVYAIGTQHENPDFNCPNFVWKSDDGTDFRLMPGQIECATGADLAAGPAGILIVTSGNATAWTNNGSEWTPRWIAAGAPDINAKVFAVAGSDDGYVAVGSIGVPQGAPGNSLSGVIWWSPDGKTWSRVAKNSPDGARYPQAEFTGVAHAADGWIAVGWQRLLGADTASAAVAWTSPDGRHWTADTRDGGTFEQYANFVGVGATADGFAIFGSHEKGEDIHGNPLGVENVLWLGSSTPAANPVGIIEGTLEEIGGPKPLLRPVAGTVEITGADGHHTEVSVGADGWYSAPVKPGPYQLVGRSPQYQDGKYACGSRIAGSDMEGDPVIVRAGVVAHVDLLCSVK